ncbi:MAG: hypothetical protein FWC40_04835 [Proteobacteria bacterium]|nr:hypothetical protein [Pseudomonadota bacterium]
MAKIGVALSALGALLSGCFYLAPIEPDPEPEDVLPYIDALGGVNPRMGTYTVNLSVNEGRQQFTVTGYGDDNIDQELFHRMVIDYRLANISSNPITATVPRTILPESRDQLSYEFTACSPHQTYPEAIKDGHVISFHVVLADDQFKFFNQYFMGEDFSLPFETRSGRRAVWVSWNVQFVGACQ